MATTLHVVRHGETDWNRGRRVQGHTDIPLNDEGRRQARELAAELAGVPFAAAYSSDLSRAAETARILLGERSLAVISCVGLREKHFGTWEGLTDTDVRERFPQAVNGAWGDGETADEMSRRVGRRTRADRRVPPERRRCSSSRTAARSVRSTARRAMILRSSRTARSRCSSTTEPCSGRRTNESVSRFPACTESSRARARLHCRRAWRTTRTSTRASRSSSRSSAASTRRASSPRTARSRTSRTSS